MATAAAAATTTADQPSSPDRISTFFTGLEARKTLLTTITDLHKALTAHFASLQHSITQKSQALDTQIESFQTHSKSALQSLENRENAIPERESAAAARIEELKTSAVSEIETSANTGGERSISEVLKTYFKRMDSSGLMRYLFAKRKESVALRAEIVAAVEEAVDPLRLVLDAVEEFLEMKVEGKVGMADRRWACGLLIGAAVPVPAPGECCVASGIRERANLVLEKWKGVLGGAEGSGGVGAGEATMFLQMVVGFGLKERFDVEFLKKLVVEFSARRDMAKLAVAVGFGDKMGEIIDELVKSGKEIEAVYFASESGLTERFPPVDLLKSYLKNCRKNANTISKRGNYSASSVEEANSSELTATRAIIKCVEDHKLESQFSMDSLKKRVAQLEKVRTDKKKSAASTGRPSHKRAHGGSSRGGGGGGSSSFRPPKAGRFSNASPGFRQRNPSHPHQASAARIAAPYSYPSRSVYEGASPASYGPVYGAAHTPISPVGRATQYPFGPQDVVAGGVRASGSYGGQGTYGGQNNYSAYDYGAPAAASAYPSSYPPSYPQ
ncbi:hypothetical protein RJ639_018574 [Escallonia herrerae]|uniref:FRIGIDA-like protein n=1 Tax=Escallonia herrerae TaxID=1293975 RepID=A0AA88V9A1_9ASTE|nr:hypothetical protein RJ639_018574 [Escallonia herrerae]